MIIEPITELMKIFDHADTVTQQRYVVKFVVKSVVKSGDFAHFRAIKTTKTSIKSTH